MARARSQQPGSEDPSPVFLYFGRELPPLTPLPPAVPANLALLALHARSRRNADTLEGGLELLELLGPSLAEPFIALPEQAMNIGNESSRNPVGTDVEGPLKSSFSGAKFGRDETKENSDSYRWEYDWLRCVYTATDKPPVLENNGVSSPEPVLRKPDRRKYKTYRPGFLEGSWEGPFTVSLHLSGPLS